MCNYENICIYYQDYAKKVRKNEMAKARKEINKLKAEVDKCKYTGLKILSDKLDNKIKTQLIATLKKKEEDYEKNFGKKLKFEKTLYPLLSQRECDCCLIRKDYAEREDKKAKRNAKYDEIVIVEDIYRTLLVKCLGCFDKEKVLKETAEYHEKLLQEKYKKKLR